MKNTAGTSRRFPRLTVAIGLAVLGLAVAVPAVAGTITCAEAQQAYAKAQDKVNAALQAKHDAAKQVSDLADRIVELNRQIQLAKQELGNCPAGEPAHTACVTRVNGKLKDLKAQKAAAKADKDDAKSDLDDAKQALEDAKAEREAAGDVIDSIPGCKKK